LPGPHFGESFAVAQAEGLQPGEAGAVPQALTVRALELQQGSAEATAAPWEAVPTVARLMVKSSADCTAATSPQAGAEQPSRINEHTIARRIAYLLVSS
jgi:hypothetical protein